MSYAGWIKLPLPGQDKSHVLTELGDYTSNVSPMWRWCLSVVTESPLQLSDTQDWTCEQAAPVLEKAVAVMEAERPRLEAMNPENGWGDYDGALKYLRNVAEAARSFAGLPGAYLDWWV